MAAAYTVDKLLQQSCHSLGYQKKGAVASTEAEMHSLLESMHRSCSSIKDQHELLFVPRDGMLFSLL